MVIAAAWITLGVVWLIAGFWTKATVTSQSPGSRLLEIAPVIAGFVLLRTNSRLLEWSATRFVPATFLWEEIGAAVTVAGIALAIWSRFYLGRNWSANVTVKQDHELIRSGPYSVVRHPIYSGILLGVLGTAIYIGEVRGLFALALILIGWKMKSLREEQFMQNEFGEQYTKYRQEVKALIPFIW